MQAKEVKILAIGPLPPPLGGATVLFKHIVGALSQRKDISLTVVSTSSDRNSLKCFRLHMFRVMYEVLRNISTVDIVSLHASISGLPLAGTVVLLITRMRRLPLLIHKFGGNDYRNCKFIRRVITKWVIMNADLYLAETKALVDLAREDGINHVKWFPNSRPMEGVSSSLPSRTKCRKYVFISQVCKDKGINQIIAAGKRFSSDVTVDIFGPLQDGYTENTFNGIKQVHYKGTLLPEEVVQVLTNYDAFILPTFHSSEGYPGVILEAYRAGLPVVCTRWGALPEIVDETSGILIEHGNTDSLYDAMKQLSQNDILFAKLQKGVICKRNLFDTTVLAEHFAEFCRDLTAED